MKQLLFSHAIALTTSIETHSVGACHAQVGVCVALLAGMIFFYAKDRPMRWPILNFTRILILLTQIGQLAMIFFSAEVIAEESVTLMSTTFCLVDALATWVCFARDWWLWDVFRGGARADIDSINTPSNWWEFWYKEDKEDKNLLSMSVRRILGQYLNDSVEMTPRVSCASPRPTFAKENVEGDVLDFSMPRLSYSPPDPSVPKETMVADINRNAMPRLLECPLLRPPSLPTSRPPSAAPKLAEVPPYQCL